MSPPITPLNQSGHRVHLDYLDGLRAIAALYVVVVHALSNVERYHAVSNADRFHKESDGPWSWLAWLFSHGHYAVGLFIILSGFCLMLPVVRGEWRLRGGALNFFKKRARRILPPYYFCLLISILFVVFLLNKETGYPWDSAIPMTSFGLISHLFLFHDAFEKTQSQINGPLWSIAVEWRIYFTFPLMVLCWRKLGPWITTLIFIVSGFLLLMALRPTPIFTYTGGVSTHFLGLFAMGALACGIAYSDESHFARWRQLPIWGWLCIAMALWIIILSGLPHIVGKRVPVTIIDLFVGIYGMALLIYVAGKQNSLLHRILSAKALVFIGGFSYSIYLMHLPLLEIFWQYFLLPAQLPVNATLLILYLVNVPITIFLCFLFFLMCEKPFLNKKKE